MVSFFINSFICALYNCNLQWKLKYKLRQMRVLIKFLMRKNRSHEVYAWSTFAKCQRFADRQYADNKLILSIHIVHPWHFLLHPAFSSDGKVHDGFFETLMLATAIPAFIRVTYSYSRNILSVGLVATRLPSRAHEFSHLPFVFCNSSPPTLIIPHCSVSLTIS